MSFRSTHTTQEAATVRAFNAEVNKVVAALAAANAPLLVGTDCCGGYVAPGESLHDEIELLVAAGVPRARVLRAATADAWRYLGQPHEAGVIEVGARADLLLLPSDPLTAPLPLVPDGVMVRGRWLPRAELDAQLANIAKHNAAPLDPWQDAVLLGVGDDVAQRERYEMALAGTPVGAERIAIRRQAGTQIFVGEIIDRVAPLDTRYEIGRDTATIKATHHTMELALEAKLVAGKVQVTGTDLTGAPVSLREPLPDGAFLSLPNAGAGGWMLLLPRLAGMKEGGKRSLPALELSYFPDIAMIAGRYDITREPDTDGHRMFGVTHVRAGSSVSARLTVDADGILEVQTLDPPANTSITRRQQ